MRARKAGRMAAIRSLGMSSPGDAEAPVCTEAGCPTAGHASMSFTQSDFRTESEGWSCIRWQTAAGSGDTVASSWGERQ